MASWSGVKGDRMATIRRATIADAAAIAALTRALGYPSDAAAMRRRLQRIEGDPSRITLVAEVDRASVGYVGVWLGYGYESDEPHARIMALVVAPEHRRSGIGRALLTSAEAWSRSQGARLVLLNSGDHRADAHGFYERMGYASTGRRYVKALQ